MPWLRQKYAYKVLTKDFKSPVLIKDRITNADDNKKGKRLQYAIEEITISPNGLCLCDEACCRGIHAWPTLEIAQEERMWSDRIIVKVKAKRWWKAEAKNDKIRAEEIEVIEVVE